MNNGKTATKRLIALLNKHGIKWDNCDGFNILRTHWERNGTSYTFTENRLNGITAFEAYSQVTPEQVIAATLGELNPDGLPCGLTISDDGSLLDWRGENYVRQSIARDVKRKSNGDVDRCETCGDDRFELIAKAKKKLLECTNIESRPEEISALDSILFRFWQMGGLDQLCEAATLGAGTCKPHGEWERVSQTQEVRCLVCDCGEELGMEERGTLPWRYHHRAALPNYCPNCGAKVVDNE